MILATESACFVSYPIANRGLSLGGSDMRIGGCGLCGSGFLGIWRLGRSMFQQFHKDPNIQKAEGLLKSTGGYLYGL